MRPTSPTAGPLRPLVACRRRASAIFFCASSVILALSAFYPLYLTTLMAALCGFNSSTEVRSTVFDAAESRRIADEVSKRQKNLRGDFVDEWGLRILRLNLNLSLTKSDTGFYFSGKVQITREKQSNEKVSSYRYLIGPLRPSRNCQNASTLLRRVHS